MLTDIEGEILDRTDRFALTRSDVREQLRQRAELLRLPAETVEPTDKETDAGRGATVGRKAA